MTTTWLYHVLDGQTVRAQVDIDDMPPKDMLEHLPCEPWPARVVQLESDDDEEIADAIAQFIKDNQIRRKKKPRADGKMYLMRCNECRYTKKQKRVGFCHKCGIGLMQAIKEI